MQFVLDHYNYWVIILLMMGGLYILFESQNLIKRLVGLSIFQTSVIVFYVTLGKVASGTAPIYVDTGDHGGGHGDETNHGTIGAGHAVDTHAGADATGHDNPATDLTHGVEEHIADAQVTDDHGVVTSDVAEAADSAKEHAADAGHGLSDAAHSAIDAVAPHTVDAGAHGVDVAHPVAEVIYSNPLPHVLMLTAIVVGVATLSVGLALVVRIREAYGTIEMDDVNSADLEDGTREGEKA